MFFFFVIVFSYIAHCLNLVATQLLDIFLIAEAELHSLLERAATAVASQQLTELKFKFGREHSSHVRKIDDKRISNICFRTYLALDTQNDKDSIYF